MLTKAAFVRMCRARDMLREVHDRPVTIDEVAREAAMSPFHFIRCFHALFGATPHQFRTEARLERARHLLAVSDYTVTEVCTEIGFTSLASFSHLFTRRVGTAPSAYRRRVRSMMTVPRALPRQFTPGCLTLMSEAFAILDNPRPGVLPDLTP